MHGNWWIPDNEDLACTGEAELSETSFSSLHVLGRLTLPAAEGHLARYLPLGDGSQIIGASDQVIWGICRAKDAHEFGQSSNLVSLFNAQLRYDMPENQTWLFRGLAEGSAHVTEKTIVDSIEVRFDVLSDWYKIQSPDVSSSQSERGFHIQIPDNRVSRISLDQATVEFHKTTLFDPYQVCYSDDAKIQITDSIKICDVLSQWVLPLYSLLGFLTLTSVGITSVRARLLDSDEEIRLDYHGLGYGQCQDSSVRRSDFPVEVNTLDGSFDCLVSSWLESYDEHASFVTLLLRSFDQSFTVANFRLLLAALALEQLHARHFDQHMEDRQDFRCKREAAVEACSASSEELANWVSDKLNHNHKSLRSKIEDILDISGGTGRRILEAWPNFARDAASARNDIAHARLDVSSDVWQIETAALGMRWIAYHSYLVLLRLPEDAVTNCVTQCQQFENDVHLIEEYRQMNSD